MIGSRRVLALAAAMLPILALQSGDICAAPLQPNPLLPEQFTASPDAADASTLRFLMKTELEAKLPCIAVAAQDKTVPLLISRELIEKVAAIGPDGYRLGSQERLASIYGERARELLKSVSKERDANGCTVANSEGGTQYLLDRLLASGQVAVFDATVHKVASPVTAIVSEMPGVGGMVAYQFEDSRSKMRTFFSLQRWVH